MGKFHSDPDMTALIERLQLSIADTRMVIHESRLLVAHTRAMIKRGKRAAKLRKVEGHWVAI